MNTTELPNKRNVVLKEMLPGEKLRDQELFQRGMEKKWIIWERTDGGRLTMQEYGSLLEGLIERDSRSETEAKIE